MGMDKGNDNIDPFRGFLVENGLCAVHNNDSDKGREGETRDVGGISRGEQWLRNCCLRKAIYLQQQGQR